MGEYAEESFVGSCTIVTPMVSSTSATHFFEDRALPSIVTLKSAVVRICGNNLSAPVLPNSYIPKSYLQLIKNLEMHSVQVADCYILQRIL